MAWHPATTRGNHVSYHGSNTTGAGLHPPDRMLHRAAAGLEVPAADPAAGLPVFSGGRVCWRMVLDPLDAAPAAARGAVSGRHAGADLGNREPRCLTGSARQGVSGVLPGLSG